MLFINNKNRVSYGLHVVVTITNHLGINGYRYVSFNQKIIFINDISIGTATIISSSF